MEVSYCYRQKGIVVPWLGEISISCVPPAFPVAGSDIFCWVVTSALESCLRKLLKRSGYSNRTRKIPFCIATYNFAIAKLLFSHAILL